MKISDATLRILKNFSEIDKSIIIQPGNKLETRSQGVMARATVEEEFPSKVCLYDLGQFLGVCSIFDDPEFTFSNKDVRISENANVLTYRFADESIIPRIPSLPEKAISHQVKIASADLQRIIKAARVVSADHIFVECTGEQVFMVAKNRHVLSHEFRLDLGESAAKQFTYPIPVDRFQMITSEDYMLGFGGIRAVNFSTPNLSYWIAMDASNV